MSGECEKCGHHAVECQCRALPPDLAGLEAQNEWLKTRLADLQLPVPDRGAADRERWLIDCGMPALEALAGRQVAVTHDAHPRSMIRAVGDEIHNLSCERQNDEDLAERLGGFATRLWQIASAAPPAPQAAEEHSWEQIPSTNTDDAHPVNVLAGVLLCAAGWTPEARIIGNVRAGDISRAIRAFDPSALAALSTPPASGKVEAEAVVDEMVEQVAQRIATAHKLFGRSYRSMAEAALTVSTPSASGTSTSAPDVVEEEAVAWRYEGHKGWCYRDDKPASPDGFWTGLEPLYSEATVAAKQAEIERLRKAMTLAHALMRECGWQLAPAAEPQGDGVLELACAEVEETFRALLKGETE